MKHFISITKRITAVLLTGALLLLDKPVKIPPVRFLTEHTQTYPVAGIHTVLAASAAHTHDGICYTGSPHNHTSGCYVSRRVEEYCGGRICKWYDEYAGGDEYLCYYVCKWRLCSNYGYDFATSSYWVPERGGATHYYGNYEEYKRCPYCNEEYPIHHRRWYQYRYFHIYASYCNKCNQNFTSTSDYRTGTHGWRWTTRNELICGKEQGAYYESNGAPGSCICDKIVSTVTPDEPVQIVQYGEPINAKATLSLYNGQIVSDYECEVTGYDPNDLSGNFQTVTLTVKDEYPYAYNAEANKRETRKQSTTIQVKVLGYYDVHLVSGEGGRIAGVRNPDGTWDSTDTTLSCLVGSRVTLAIIPDRGYTVKLLKTTNAENTTTNLAAEVGTENEYMNPVADLTKNGTVITYSFTMPVGEVELSAVFMGQKHIVTFDPAGGGWAGRTRDVVKTAVYGKSYISEHTFPDDPHRTGYIFNGWYDNAGRRYEVWDICDVTRDLTLHASWLSVSNAVKYVGFEDILDYPAPVSIEGFWSDLHTFWRLYEKNNNGYGEALERGTILRLTDPMTLYGHWEPKEYTVSFDATGGEIISGEEEKKVYYHTVFGELPEAVKDGAVFTGWYTDTEKGERVTENDCLTIPHDITLYAGWQEDDGNTAVLSAELVRVNNLPVIFRDAFGVPVTFPGNRLTVFFDAKLPRDAKAPFTYSLIPNYYILSEEETLEKVHVLSTGRVGDSTVTFYERGKDVDDVMTEEADSANETLVFHWVLPHLSFAVREENYAEMLRISEINTLSGQEDFFENDRDMIVVFDISVTDATGKSWRKDGALTVIITKNEAPGP